MKKNTFVVLFVLLIVVFALTACGQKATTTTAPTKTEAAPAATEPAAVEATTETTAAVEATTVTSSDAEKTFTLEELAKFDGKNGAAAYIAVDGVVYDVTNVPEWKEGGHNGYTAGKDLSAEIKKAPHGLTKLEGLTVVGKLAK